MNTAQLFTHQEAKKQFKGRWPVAVTKQIQSTFNTTVPSARKLVPTSGIYIIHSHSNWYKIGQTQVNPLKRLHGLQVGNPFTLTLIDFIPCPPDQLNQFEAYCHNYFWKCRGRGEWFTLTKRQVTSIRELAPSL